MRRRQFNRLAQVAQRLCQRLIGQAVHQVEVEAAQPQTARQARGAFGLFRPVDAPKTLELAVAKALYPDRNAINARPLVLDEAVSFDCPRVGFHGDFCIRGQRQTRANAVQQSLHRRA